MSIEDFIKYYFPNINDKGFTDRLKQLEHSTIQQFAWGRSIGDEAAKYDYSLYNTAIALLEGKCVLTIGKFENKIMEDLKIRFNIEVTCEEQKNGCLLKLK